MKKIKTKQLGAVAIASDGEHSAIGVTLDLAAEAVAGMQRQAAPNLQEALGTKNSFSGFLNARNVAIKLREMGDEITLTRVEIYALKECFPDFKEFVNNCGT